MPEGLIGIVLAVLIVAVGAWWRHNARSKIITPPPHPMRSKLRVVQGGLTDSSEKRSRQAPVEGRLERDTLTGRQEGSPGQTGEKDR